MYRKVADYVYISAVSKDDPVFEETRHLAQVLELPEKLQRLADNGAKKVAYFSRCRKIISGEEPLTINEINNVFGYDYEDGYDIRVQVFHDYLNKKFDEIAEQQRFSPDEETALREICTKLDIPYEFKPNIQNALDKYRYLWSAENAPLGDIKVDFPLNEGEICHAAAQQAGFCEHKTIEKEDNYFELTRRLEIDETISFKGEKIEHPHFTEEVTAVVDIGYLFFTNQRIIYLSNKMAKIVELNDLDNANLSVNIIYFTKKDGESIAIKFNDDVAEVMFAIFKQHFKRTLIDPGGLKMQEQIRFVELKDSTGILNIYTPYVLDTTISFEYEPPTLAEFTERISNISSKYPYLVYERNGKILGFAYGSPYQERIAYLYDADLSIYLAPEAQNSGVGKKLYSCLLDLLQKQGFYNVYACITANNQRSIDFHAAFGFRNLGPHPKAGYKLTSGWISSGWTNSCSSLTVLLRPLKPISAFNNNDILKLF